MEGTPHEPRSELCLSRVSAEPIEEAPVKRPRGRPKGKAKAKPEPKPKAVPKAPVLKREITRRKPQPEQYSDDSSTSEEEMVGRLMEDDLSTQVLRFLTARKMDQETKTKSKSESRMVK